MLKKKNRIMTVTTRQIWQHLDETDVNICINGDKLQVVENERLVEFLVDNFLTWMAHIQNIHNTIAGKLAFLCIIKQCLPYKARTTFYKSYMLPHMDYCSTIWGIAATSDRIYKLQRHAARVITDSEYRAPSDPLLKQTGCHYRSASNTDSRSWCIKQ